MAADMRRAAIIIYETLRIALSFVPKPGGLGQRWGENCPKSETRKECENDYYKPVTEIITISIYLSKSLKS